MPRQASRNKRTDVQEDAVTRRHAGKENIKIEEKDSDCEIVAEAREVGTKRRRAVKTEPEAKDEECVKVPLKQLNRAGVGTVMEEAVVPVKKLSKRPKKNGEIIFSTNQHVLYAGWMMNNIHTHTHMHKRMIDARYAK
jgi:hypothetical protein